MWTPDSETNYKDYADHGIPKYSISNIYHTHERLRNILKYLHTLSVLLPWDAVSLSGASQEEVTRRNLSSVPT